MTEAIGKWCSGLMLYVLYVSHIITRPTLQQGWALLRVVPALLKPADILSARWDFFWSVGNLINPLHNPYPIYHSVNLF